MPCERSPILLIQTFHHFPNTFLEPKYALIIDELRNKTYLDKVVEVEKFFIPDFINHLSIRTKHLIVSLE